MPSLVNHFLDMESKVGYPPSTRYFTSQILQGLFEIVIILVLLGLVQVRSTACNRDV